MGLFDRLLGRGDEKAPLRPLYAAIVAEARQPRWYLEGGVADTNEGRFEMIAAVHSLVTFRLEALGDEGQVPNARLTDCFVEDMHGQLREIGVGDVGVGKELGAMVSALGGRMGAYRDGLAGRGDFDAALVRNLYRGEAPEPAALAHTRTMLEDLDSRLKTRSFDDLLAARL
jgi:cytochrome b pre-mRNA-processing protein 3